VAGQVAEGANGAEQVERALAAVDACCREAGGSLADITSMTWYTTESVSRLWADTASARQKMLPDPPPAMTVVRVAELADPKYFVEISGVAVVATG
jgi:enamine deaminase RidA (YjgF/YER057c/UK114 family)